MKKTKGVKIIGVRSDELHQWVMDYVDQVADGETDASVVVRTALREYLRKVAPELNPTAKKKHG